MEENNKKGLKKGLNILIMIIWAILTIATCCIVWNSVPGLGFAITAGALFAFNSAAIIEKIRRLKE